MAYDIRDALLVLRTINTILQQNPELLNEEGVFRLSGSSNNVDEIINTIIDPTAYSAKLETILSNKSLSIHDLIGAAKKVIRNLPPIDNQTFALMDQVADKDNSLDSVFYQLVNSGNLDKMYYAEILYNYVQMMDASRTFEKTTKMSTSNLAMMLGQALSGGTSDLTTIEKFKSFSERVIDAEAYHSSTPFTMYIGVKYPELLPKMKEARQNLINDRMKGLKNIGDYINNLKKNLNVSKILKDQLVDALGKVETQIQEKKDKKDSKTVEQLQKQKETLQSKLELIDLKINNIQMAYDQTTFMQKHDMGTAMDLHASLKNIDVLTKEREKVEVRSSEKGGNLITDTNDDDMLNTEAPLNPQEGKQEVETGFEVQLSEGLPEMPPLVEISDDEILKIALKESQNPDEIISGPPPEPDISKLDPVEDKETIQILQDLHKLYLSQWESEQKSRQQANILREVTPVMPELNLLISNSGSISNPSEVQSLTQSQEIQEIFRKIRAQKPKATIVLKGLDDNPLYLTPREFAQKMKEVEENWDMTDDFVLTQSDIERLENAPSFVSKPLTSPKTKATVKDKSLFAKQPEERQNSNAELDEEYDSDDEPEKRPKN